MQCGFRVVCGWGCGCGRWGDCWGFLWVSVRGLLSLLFVAGLLVCHCGFGLWCLMACVYGAWGLVAVLLGCSVGFSLWECSCGGREAVRAVFWAVW